jgi:hypothetical protein
VVQPQRRVTIGAIAQRRCTAGLVEGDPGGAMRFKFMARDGASIGPAISS